ncbi:Hypothetical Protein FCC1311_061582 [Hondaea fermentalgiana]|uniref:Seipin n=1 Tax=Hondaea fermentalgiana TaxID=2315210 RepID=A0A2R5GJM2_9STRA|nr:Hypothetical Protein FCC1311_061582 [Hondaea fermentalgiana]|eukprot:GBG29938.1 Hypothetical Protein FCC1311_061582 [Hondaea fermentalgiana]
MDMDYDHIDANDGLLGGGARAYENVPGAGARPGPPGLRSRFSGQPFASEGGQRGGRRDGFTPRQAQVSRQYKPWIPLGVRQLVLRSTAAYGVASMLMLLSVSIAIFLYVSVYYQVMPDKLALEAKLYFDYDPSDDGQTGLDSIARREGPSLPVSMPLAELDLHRASRQWTSSKSTHDDGHETPAPDVMLAPGFLYDISLQLALPAAEDRLLNVGNFMVAAKLSSRRKHELARSKRPALALARPKPKAWRPRSWLSVFIPFSLFQTWHSEEYDPALEEAIAMEADQLVWIELFEGYRERYEHEGRVRFVSVHLSSPLVQLHGATLHMHCRLEGLAFYMYHYFVTAFAVYLFVVSSIIAFGLYGVATAFSLFSAFSAFAGGEDDTMDEDESMPPEYEINATQRGFDDNDENLGGNYGFGPPNPFVDAADDLDEDDVNLGNDALGFGADTNLLHPPECST